jgi:hypothetical protein
VGLADPWEEAKVAVRGRYLSWGLGFGGEVGCLGVGWCGKWWLTAACYGGSVGAKVRCKFLAVVDGTRARPKAN